MTLWQSPGSSYSVVRPVPSSEQGEDPGLCLPFLCSPQMLYSEGQKKQRFYLWLLCYCILFMLFKSFRRVRFVELVFAAFLLDWKGRGKIWVWPLWIWYWRGEQPMMELFESARWYLWCVKRYVNVHKRTAILHPTLWGYGLCTTLCNTANYWIFWI